MAVIDPARRAVAQGDALGIEQHLAGRAAGAGREGRSVAESAKAQLPVERVRLGEEVVAPARGLGLDGADPVHEAGIAGRSAGASW